jgi:hypothetical protein
VAAGRPQDVTTFYPLPEAAVRLGVSQASLRRRVRNGVAQAERRPHAGGFAWWVACDEPAATPGQPTGSPGVAPQEGLTGEAVRRLEAHVADLRDQLKAREREVAELHVTMNRLLLALPAPAPSPSTNGIAHGQAAESSGPGSSNGVFDDRPLGMQSSPPPRDPAGRSWWQRLRLVWG